MSEERQTYEHLLKAYINAVMYKWSGTISFDVVLVRGERGVLPVTYI